MQIHPHILYGIDMNLGRIMPWNIYGIANPTQAGAVARLPLASVVLKPLAKVLATAPGSVIIIHSELFPVCVVCADVDGAQETNPEFRPHT